MRTLLALAAPLAAIASSVYSIEASQGSLGGQTRVTVWGAGFERDGTDGQTVVYFGNDVCTVEDYSSTDTKLVCYSPPSTAAQTVTVQVAVIQLNAKHLFSACPSANCLFTYRWDRTPRVDWMFLGGSIGKAFRAQGQFYVSDESMAEVRIGGSRCDFAEGGWQPSYFRCTLGDLTAGRYNVTARLHSPTAGYGQSMFSNRARQVARDGSLYQFTMHPHVDTLSFTSSGLVGGQELVITGSGFSWDAAANTVDLAGTPCNVTSATGTELRCRVGTAPATTPFNTSSGVLYASGRGLLHRIYYNTNSMPNYNTLFYQNRDFVVAPATTYVNTHGTLGAIDNEADYYSQDLTGFFVPPVTANYSFYTRADDVLLVWLSTNENPANARVVANTPWYNWNWFNVAGQISAPIELIAGRRYWTRIRHADGIGGDFFDVALRIHATDNAAATAMFASDNQRRFASVPEVQYVTAAVAITREVQSIFVYGATGGVFYITVGGVPYGVTTSNPQGFPFTTTLTDSQFANGLNGVTGCWSIGVRRSPANRTSDNVPGFRWDITFNCPAPAPTFLRTMLAVDTYNLLGGAVSAAASRAVVPSEPMRGTFRLMNPVSNATTNPIAFNADSGSVKAALEAALAGANVEVNLLGASTSEYYQWAVTYWAPFGQQPNLVPLLAEEFGASLTGTNASVTVTEVQAGSTDPFYWPIPADFFETALPVPAVRVTSNGILGDCDVQGFNVTNMACAFRFDDALTPSVTAVSATSVTVGDVLTVTGTGFLTAADGIGRGPGGTDLTVGALNRVYLNDSVCNVTAATATSLTCTVAHAAAGTYVVAVEVYRRGYARVAAGVAPIAYPMVLAGFSPSAGSTAGGTLLTLTGTGFRAFASGNAITVGGAACAIEGVPTFASLTCRTPAGSNGTAAAVTANGVTAAGTFAYASSLTAVVTSLTPRRQSVAITGVVNMTLTNVPAGSQPVVTFGTRACRIAVFTQTAGVTFISCQLVRGQAPPLPQAAVRPTVDVVGRGYADAAAWDLDVGFRVNSMSRQVGSLEGGAEVTFFGVGFSPLYWPNEIIFRHVDTWGYEWRHPCPILTYAPDGSNVTCTMAAIPMFHRGDPRLVNSTTPVSGIFWVKVNNITAPCDASLNGCAYEQNIGATPIVSNWSISAEPAAASGLALQLTGSQLPVPGMHVEFGAYSCRPIVALDSSNVRCHVPVGIAGPVTITAHVHALGMARMNASYVFPLTVSGGPSATTGSAAGGTRIVLRGAGFASDSLARNLVYFGTSPSTSSRLVVTFANTTYMEALTPPQPIAANATYWLTVQVLDVDLLNPVATVVLPNAFTYDATTAFTPTIAAVAPNSGFAGDLLVITGTGFGNFSAAHTVLVGAVPCDILTNGSFTDTRLLCTLGASPAGAHRVLVSIDGKGYARAPSTTGIVFTSRLEVTGISGTVTSYGGGSRVVVTGRGFAPAGATAIGTNMIMACNVACNVTAATYTSLSCDTSAVVTSEALSQYDGLFLSARLLGASATPAAAFDNNVETTFASSCNVDLDMGAANRAVVTALRFFPRFRSVALLRGGRFLASNDATAWVELARVGASVQEAWNEIVLYNGPGQARTDLGTLPTYRYLRFAFAGTGSNCAAAEFSFVGVPVAAAGGSCPLTVTVDAADLPRVFTGVVAPVVASPSSAFNLNYSSAATPFVSSISPNNGTTLGGTIVTITGTGFPTSTSDVTVALNGIACPIVTTSATAITCVTGPRTTISPVSVAVRVSGASATTNGLALYDASRTYYRYLDRWSELSTWKYNEPPLAGDTVIIPEGQSVLMDVNTPRLFLVLVQGELIFDRKDVSFDAFYIFVHGGRFEVGTEAEPFMQRAVITAHGDRYGSIELPEVGTKMLAVMDRGGVDSRSEGSHSHGSGLQGRRFSQGNLELHGRPRRRVWTLLDTTAAAGTDILTLSEDVDWQVGEQLVVTAPGALGDVEEVVVAEVQGPRRLRLAAPLANTHTSAWFPAGQYGHADIDMRAEVGLLSRNVIVQGDDRSERQMFGVHMGAFHGGVMRVENIEIRRCGQMGLLGRYCSHTHMLSDDWVSYIRGNSIHHSQQRATTIHATNYLTVKHNFAYNVFGHTIFVEDGVERWNVIEENLVVRTKICNFCTSSDTKPANFWTASPTNIWRHNRAAGSTHFGFWFELPGNPLGPSYTPNYCPSREVLVEFFNNTAHSNSIGLRVYPHWGPSTDPCGGGPGMSQYLRNSTFFWNSEGTFHRVVGMVHHLNTRWVENGHGWGWRQFEDGVSYELTLGNPLVRNGLFICSRSGGGGCGSRAITMPQSEFWYGADSTFLNYGNSGVLAGCHSCESDANFRQGGYTYRWSGTNFVNSAVRTFWNPPRKCIMWDLDGTLTGFVNGTVTPWYGFNDWAECPRDAVGTYSYGTVCNGAAMIRRMQIDYHEPRELDWVTMNITSAAGWGLVQFRPKEFYGWSYPAASMHNYRHAFRGSLVDWRRHRTRYSEPEYIEQGPHPTTEFMLSTWTWIDRRYRNQVLYGSSQRERADLQVAGVMPDPALHQFGTGNRPDDANKTWTVVLNTVNITDTGRDRYMYTAWNIQCPPRGCDVPDAAPLGNATLWSAAATWGSLGVPAAGADVTINASMYVIMDVNPPKLGRVTVIGRLEFLDDANRKLEADAIVVWGELVVGTPETPFTNNAEIVLHGVRTSPAVILDNNLFLSNKVMAVLGRVTMVGRSRPITWTRLATTAGAGATSLTLTQSVASAWSVGDRIAISSTEWNHTQYEDVTITGVSGATVTVSPALRFRHYAGPAGTNATLRAAVGLLSRNVVFRGNLVDASDTYGASMVVSAIRRVSGTQVTRREGVVDLRYVELRNTGKQLTEHAGILFQYGSFLFDTTVPATNPINYLEGLAFRDSFNYGIVATAAKHITVTNSVFHRNFRNSLDVDKDSTNATVTANLFIGNMRSPDVNADDQIPWVRPQSAVYIDNVPRALSGNVVSGAIDAAYTYRVPACAADHARWYSRNEAHGVRIGVFMLPTTNAAGCVRVDGATVWKAAHIGILAVDAIANIEVTGAVVSDNHIGVSLNYIKEGREESYSRLRNSVIYGTTAASGSCAESVRCAAASKEDTAGDGCNSVLGAGYRRAGWLMPQYTNRGKTCDQDWLPVCRPANMPERLCSMPWERRYGTISTVNTAAYLENVRFGFFSLSDCGARSTAVVHNPTQIDQSVPHYASGIVWEGVGVDSRFHLTWNQYTDEKCSDGVGCDSLNNMDIRDLDGSLTGTRGGLVVGPNPTNIYGTPDCVARTNWTGFECPAVRLIRGHIEAVDAGRVAMGGLQVIRRPDTADNTTWRTSMSFGSIKDLCAKRGEQPLYAHFVAANQETHLFWPATEPGQIRYRFFSRSPADAAVISLFIQRPYSWSLFVNGVEVPMLEAPNATTYFLPQPTDPVGTWLFHPQRRHIWFTVRGTAGGAATWIDLVRKPTVQLNLHLAVTVEQFFGPDLITNLALLLQIEPWRIKIAETRPGSVNVKVEISDSQPTVVAATANDTASVVAATAQFERMQTLATRVQTMASTGQLSTIGSYTVLSVAITPPAPPAVVVTDTPIDSTPTVIVPTSAARAGLTPGQIAGAAIGAIAGVLIIAGALIMYRRASGADRRALLTRGTKVASVDAAGPDKMASPSPAVDGVDFMNPSWSRRGGSAPSPVARAASARMVWQPTGAHSGRSIASGSRV